MAVNSVSYTFDHPGALRPAAAFHALAAACEYILLRLWTFSWFGALLIACAALTTFRARRDVTLVSAAVLPLVSAVAEFSLWQLPFDHYWFLTVAPCAALTVGLALTARRPAASLITWTLVFVLAAAQPARLADAMTLLRLLEYGPLVRGSQEIRKRVREARSIELEVALPPSTDPYFIYKEVLGGQISPTAPFAATIESTGRVRFTPAP